MNWRFGFVVSFGWLYNGYRSVWLSIEFGAWHWWLSWWDTVRVHPKPDQKVLHAGSEMTWYCCRGFARRLAQVRIEQRVARAIKEIDIALFTATTVGGRHGLHEARDALYGVLERMGLEITIDTYRARRRRAKKPTGQ